MSRLKSAAAGALLVAVSTGADAATVIDVDQPSAPIFGVAFNQGPIVQSFKPTADNVAGAGFFVSDGIFGGALNGQTITIDLRDALPIDGGSTLASGSAQAFADGYLDVFWSPVAVTPGAAMFLVVSSSVLDLTGIRGDADVYADGAMFTANGATLVIPGQDNAFRTFTDDAFSSSAVPLPAALPMLLAGIATLCVAGWRRRGGRRT